MIIVNVMTLNLYMFLRVATLSQPPGWINDDDNVNDDDNDDSLRGESFLSTDETDDTVFCEWLRSRCLRGDIFIARRRRRIHRKHTRGACMWPPGG